MAENASVRIVIDAITEAAEKALDQVGDELSNLGVDGEVAQSVLDEVGDELNNASGDAGLFKAAVDRAKSGARGLAISLGILQGRADEAGDEIAQAGGSAAGTTGLFSVLLLSTEGLSLSFGSLSTKITLVLIPAIAALLSTLAPLAATLATAAAAATGLAGAFGLIVGSGILAYGDKLSKQNKERLKQINTEIKRLEDLRKKRGGLSDKEQERLKQARDVVDRLREKAASEEQLTDKELERLRAATETIQSLQEKRQKTAKLTEEEQKRLKTLKEKKKELQEQTSVTGALSAKLGDLKKEIMPLVVEFGQKFIPLIEDAVDALPTLVQDTLDAVGGLSEFKSALRDFGSGAMDAIPALVGGLVDLGEQALPVVEDLVSFLAGDGADAFSEMVATTKELGPTFSGFIDALIDAAPAINDFGTEVLKRLLPALGELIKDGADLMSKVDWDSVDATFARLSEIARELAPYLNQLAVEAVEFGKSLVPIIQEILPTLVKFLKFTAWAIGIVLEAWNNLSPGQQKAVFVALAVAIGALGGPLTALAAAIAIVGVAFDDMKALAAGAMDWLDTKLAAAAGWVDAFVSDAETFLSNLSQLFVVELAKAYGVAVAEGNKIYNFFVGLWNGLLGLATTGLEGLTNKFVSGLNRLISTMNSMIQKANKKIPGFKMDQFGKLDQVQLDTGSLEAEKRSTNASAMSKNAAQAVAVDIGFDTRGEGPLAEFVDQRAEAKVRRSERGKTRRLKRQGTNPV